MTGSKKWILVFLMTLSGAGFCHAQSSVETYLSPTPSWAVKTNLLYDATASIDLGLEVRLSRKWTLNLQATDNPWTFKDNMKWSFFLAQPEARYWLCEAFNGHFFGLHAHYAKFNVGGLPDPPFSEYMNTHRFEGWLAGAGVSYGYQWILGNHWSLEATLGVGYAYLKYKIFECEKCGPYIESTHKNYFGPTKIGVSLIYVIR